MPLVSCPLSAVLPVRMTARLGRDRIGHEGPVKIIPPWQPVDVGRFVPVRPISRNSLIGVIIGKDEEDAQRFGGHCDLWPTKCARRRAENFISTMETTCFCIGN